MSALSLKMTEKNPKYNGPHVFKINVVKLNAGDVLLTRNVEASTFDLALQIAWEPELYLQSFPSEVF